MHVAIVIDFFSFCLPVRPKTRISYNSPELLHTSEKNAGCLYDLDDLDVKWLQIMRNSGKKGKSFHNQLYRICKIGHLDL